jgi:hypothetical protein
MHGSLLSLQPNPPYSLPEIARVLVLLHAARNAHNAHRSDLCGRKSCAAARLARTSKIFLLISLVQCLCILQRVSGWEAAKTTEMRACLLQPC